MVKSLKISLKPIIQFIQKSKKTVLLIVIVSAATLLISTAASIWLSNVHNLRFSSVGTIVVKDVKAYGGSIQHDAQGKLTIDWGTVYPGKQVTRSFNISSESNVPVTLILFGVTSANITFLNSTNGRVTEAPPIDKPVMLSSNFNNTVLKPNEVIYATLTLEFSSHGDFLQYLIRNNVTAFSFEIIIIAL